MSDYEFLLFLHITAAFLGFGLLFSLPYMISRVKAKSPAGLPGIYGSSATTLRLLVTPAMVVVLITGSMLISKAGFGFGEPWVSVSFALILILFALVGAYLIPTNRKLAELTATELELSSNYQEPDFSSDTKQLARQLTVLSICTNLLVVIAIFMMTFKPGA